MFNNPEFEILDSEMFNNPELENIKMN